VISGKLRMDPRDEVDAILAQHFAARGGYARLKSIATLRLIGTYSEGGYDFPALILWKRPHWRVVITGPEATAWVEGFNGAAWEYSRETGELTLTSGDAEAATRRGAEFDDSFVDYRQKGHRVELMGIESMGGRRAHCIRVVLADGWVRHYYLDVDTHLVIALRKSMPLHAVGEPIESLSTSEDYRPVSGVLYPFRSVERATRTGEVMNTLQWHEIEANVAIDDAAFDPPVRPR
jgi:hypothetical protein